MKTLYLEKRGCNFWDDETVESDIKNYRVCTNGEDIHGKDGNIIERYDETQKNRGQMSLFLDEMYIQLDELEQQQGITTDDEYALCEWQWVLEDIYENYRDTVSDKVLFCCLGVCHMLRKRSAVEGKKESYYE